MSSPLSNTTPSKPRRSPGDRPGTKGWIYLPPGSNEHFPKNLQSSAIDEDHIIGKRLRSNLKSDQTPSKVNKTHVDRPKGIHRKGFENDSERLLEYVEISKPLTKTINSKKESGNVSNSLRIAPIQDVNDDVSTSSSLTELDDVLSESNQEDLPVALDTTPCPSPGQEETNRTNAEINFDHSLYTERCLRERVYFLEQQVTGLMAQKTEKEAQYEKTIGTLVEQNYKQNVRLETLRASEDKRPQSTANDDRMDLLIDDLYAQDKEIRRLKSNLNESLRLNELLSPRSNKIYAIDLATSTRNLMRQIESSTILAADMLCQALSHNPLEQSPQQETKAFVLDSIGDGNLLQSHSSAAFRAMIFKYIRDRIFYSTDMWSSLHLESLMLRAYQTTLQNAVAPEFLERFHRAALHHMLQDSDFLKNTFVIPHAELLRTDMISLFRPIIDHSLLQRFGHHEDLRKCLKDLFCDAIELRASYFPSPGTRYELIQYKPGTIYDPQLMQVQSVLMASPEISLHDTKPLRIKLCVHGSIIAHTVSESSSAGFDRIRDWSQPFITEAENRDSHNYLPKGKLASQKACVILEENGLV